LFHAARNVLQTALQNATRHPSAVTLLNAALIERTGGDSVSMNMESRPPSAG